MIQIRTFELMGELTSWYKVLNVSGYFVMWIFLTILAFRRKDDLAPNDTGVWLFVKIAGIIPIVFFPQNGMNKIFGDLITDGHANYFGNLVTAWIFMLAACMIFFVRPVKYMDFIACGLPIALFCFKLACHCAGCCYGNEWTYGIYSFKRQRFEVPIQLTEALIAVLIAVILVWYLDRAKKGTVAPMYIMLYSVTRFVTEFFRDDFPNIVGPFNINHIQCVVAFVYGYVFFRLMVKYGERIDDFFGNLFERWTTECKILAKIKGLVLKKESDSNDETI